MDQLKKLQLAGTVTLVWIIIGAILPKDNLLVSYLYVIILLILFVNIFVQAYKLDKIAKKDKELKKIKDDWLKERIKLFAPIFIILIFVTIVKILVKPFYELSTLEHTIIVVVLALLYYIVYNKMIKKK